MAVEAPTKAATRSGRRSSAQRLRRHAGQTLILFALTLTSLIAVLGLAIDTIRIFDLYARMERAAEAGALAGVIYLPNNYNTPLVGTPNSDSAVSRASREVVKNGFGTVLSNNDTTVADFCPANVKTVEVAVCLVPGQQDKLQVTITETTNVVILSALGAGPTTISASSEASYLPLIHLASRSNTFGDQVECYTTDSTGSSSCDRNDTTRTHLDSYMASMSGPADLVESGDPYVDCAEGPTDAALVGGRDPATSGYTYNGYYPSNHPQWSGVSTGSSALSGIAQYCGAPGSNPGNPNQQPQGFSGPMTSSTAHPGGYNYQISVPSGNTGSLWIFNPNFIPGPNHSDVSTVLPNPDLDQFVDGGSGDRNFYQGPQGEGIGNRFNGLYDAPLFYYNVTYTLYRVVNIYDRSTDVQVASTTYPPYDGEYNDLVAHGCDTGSQLYNPYWQGGNTLNTYYDPNGASLQGGSNECLPLPTIQQQQGCNPQSWCKLAVPGGVSAGTYRLVVEATGLFANTSAYQSTTLDGWGSHNYALKVCASNTITSPVGNCGVIGQTSPNVSIAAWNNDDVILQGTLTSPAPSSSNPQTSCVTSNTLPYACFDVACIPTVYAGRTLTISIFDPGDSANSGNLYIGVVPPDSTTATVSYPATATTSTKDGNAVVQTLNNSQRYYNGLWLTAQITLGASYTGTCGASGTGWWQLMYASSEGVRVTDKIAVKLSVVGSPVHLAIPG